MRWWQKQYRHSRLKRVILLDVKQSSAVTSSWSEAGKPVHLRAGFLSTSAKSGMSATYSVHMLSILWTRGPVTAHWLQIMWCFYHTIRMNVHLPRSELRLFFCPLRIHTCNCTKSPTHPSGNDCGGSADRQVAVTPCILHVRHGWMIESRSESTLYYYSWFKLMYAAVGSCQMVQGSVRHSSFDLDCVPAFNCYERWHWRFYLYMY